MCHPAPCCCWCALWECLSVPLWAETEFPGKSTRSSAVCRCCSWGRLCWGRACVSWESPPATASRAQSTGWPQASLDRSPIAPRCQASFACMPRAATRGLLPDTCWRTRSPSPSCREMPEASDAPVALRNPRDGSASVARRGVCVSHLDSN